MSTRSQVRRAGTEPFLDRHPVFTRPMFAQAHGERRPSPALIKRLKYLQATGRVVSLERGLYATVRPGGDPHAVAPDPYLVAAVLRPDGVFAYHSALTLLGAGHADWNVVTVLSHPRRRPLVLPSRRVEVLPHPAALVRKDAVHLGVRQVPYLDRTLRVTGPERTLADGFRQLRLVGGLEELVTSAAGFPSLDLEQLDAVLRAYDLRLLYAGVGWFLETYRAHFFVPDAFLGRLEKRRPAAPQYLPRRARGEGDGGRLVPRWNLILPEAVLRGAEPDEPRLEPRSHRHSASGAAVRGGRAPQVIVIGGPNGAGKTSSAPELLRDTIGIDAFVNADVIAEGLSGFRPEDSVIEAGRILLARLRELAERGADFAFESTLSGRTVHALLGRLTDSGYECHIFYLWLSSVNLAVARVRHRVQAGGHDVPEPVIRRRFRKSLVNFDRLYRPAATTWRLYDGSAAVGRRLIAHGAAGGQQTVVDAERWALVRRQIEEENQ